MGEIEKGGEGEKMVWEKKKKKAWGKKEKGRGGRKRKDSFSFLSPRGGGCDAVVALHAVAARSRRTCAIG